MPSDTYNFILELDGTKALRTADSFITSLQSRFRSTKMSSVVPTGVVKNISSGADALAKFGPALKEVNKEITSNSARTRTWIGRMKEVEQVVALMGARIRTEYKLLSVEEKKLFRQLVPLAQDASKKVVTGSIIPDMVRAIIVWYGRLKSAGTTVFDPLVMSATSATTQVNQRWSQSVAAMRAGQPRFPAGANFQGVNVGGRLTTAAAYNAWAQTVGAAPWPVSPPVGVPSPANWNPLARPGYIDRVVRQNAEAMSGVMMNRAQVEFQRRSLEAMNSYVLSQGPQQGARYVSGYRRRMEEFGKATGRFGMSPLEYIGAGPLERWGRAVQQAQSENWGIRSFGYEVGRQGRSLMFAGMGTLGAGYGAMQKYIEYANPLERAARNLELNAEMTEKLNKALREQAGVTTTLTATEQAEGLYQWAAATGATVKTTEELNAVLGTTNSIQKLAILNNKEFKGTTELVTDVQSQFQLGLDKTSYVTAVLNRVAAVSKADLDDLGESFKYVGARAQQSGVSFEQVAAMFELLAASGQRGGQAGRGLQRLFDNLIAPAGEAADILESLVGPNGLTDEATGQFVGMDVAVDRLAASFEKMTAMEKQQVIAALTTQNAARELIPLIEMQTEARRRGFNVIKVAAGEASASETEAYTQMMKDLYGYTVSTENAVTMLDRYWSEYLNGDAGRAASVKAHWDSALLDIGKAVTDVMLPALTRVTGQLTDVITTVEDSPWVVESVLKGAGVAVAVGALAMVLSKPITLYADYKMVAASGAMLKAADRMMEAALTYVAGAPAAAGGAATKGVLATWLATSGKGILSMVGKAGVAGLLAFLGYKGAESLGGEASNLMWGPGGGPGGEASKQQGIQYGLSKGYPAWLLSFLHGARAVEEVASRRVLREDVLQEEQQSFLEVRRNEVAQAYVRQTVADLLKEFAKVAKVQKAPEEYLDTRSQELENRARYLELESEIRRRLTESYANDPAALFRRIAALQRGPDLSGTLYSFRGLAPLQGAQGEKEETKYELSILLELAKELNQTVVDTGGGFRNWSDILSEVSKNLETAYRAPIFTELEKLKGDITTYMEAPLTAEDLAGQYGTKAGQLISQITGDLTGKVSAEEQRKHLEDTLALLASLYTEAVGKSQYWLDVELAGVLENEEAKRQAYIDTFNLKNELAQTGVTAYMGLPVDPVELARQQDQAAQRGVKNIMTLAGILTPDQLRARAERFLSALDLEYKKVAGKSQFYVDLGVEQFLEGEDEKTSVIKEANDERERLTKKSLSQTLADLEQANRAFRSKIEGILSTPTPVTGLQMAETALGRYRTQWDENARRVRAAMEGSPDWDFLIPSSVKEGGEDSIRAWGEKWLDDFYNGMMPDQVDWTAFADEFQGQMNRYFAKEAFIDRAVKELGDRGIDVKRADVQKFLGLETPIAKMITGGLSAKTIGDALSEVAGDTIKEIDAPPEDYTAAALTVSEKFSGALSTQMAAVSWTGVLRGAIETSLKADPLGLEPAGRALGKPVVEGIKKAIEATDFVTMIVAIVFAQVMERLKRR